MKIVMLAAPSDIHCVRWANGLKSNQNEVHIIYLNKFKPLLNELSNDISLHQLPIPAPLGYYLNVLYARSIIKKINPDVIHVHQASGHGTFGRLVLKDLNIPNVLSVYGSDIYDFPYKSKFNMKTIKKNLRFYDFIASTSNVMAKQINKIESEINLENIYITPFGVQLDKFNFTPKNNLSTPIIIGSIKKLEPKYGIEYGILALSYIIENNLVETSMEYRIFGEGSQEEELKKLVKNKGLTDIVKFFSRIPNYEVPSQLENIDIFLAPSTLDSESFGVSVVEAMAKGTSVIASNVDGFSEVLDKGNCGVLVPKKDIKALAFAIKKLIDDNSKRLEYICKANHRVKQLYDWEKNIEFMEKIYKEAIVSR